MKKKGFTLFELLGVIVVLSLVLGLAVVAYLGLGDNIDKTYYRTLEESLEVSGTNYFYYNKGEAPVIFGEQRRVKLSYLKENNYIEDEVKGSNGEECNLEDSYVGAYKNGLDETKYYVCLICGEYRTEDCDLEIDYTLSLRGKEEETNKNYDLDGTKWSSKNIILTFETINEVEKVHVNGNNFSKSCNMEKKGKFYTCQITLENSGTYTYYGTYKENKTDTKEVKVLIDKTPATFDFQNEGSSNTIEVETTTLKAKISNEIKNIIDNESGIKEVEYSFVKEGEKDNYQKIANTSSFKVDREVEIGKYSLKVRVTNNANLVTVKEIKYDVYKKVNDSSANNYCNSLVYNDEIQVLTKEAEEFTFSDNEGVYAGSYQVKATLKYGYRWSDNTTLDKTITCSIAERPVTITAKPQTVTYGTGITKGIEQITATNLVEGHKVTEVTLTQSTTSATTTGKITPSNAKIEVMEVDVTSNYKITYVDGNLTIKQKDVSELSITLNPTSFTYDGTAKEPAVTVKDGNKELEQGKDYNVSYSNNINAGLEANVRVSGIGNYTGSKDTKFTINQRATTITANNQTITYGEPISKEVSQITASNLVSGQSVTSITLTQSTSNVTTTGKITPSAAVISTTTSTVTPNYSISYAVGNLTISPKAVSGLSVTLNPTSFTYDGTAKEPTVTVKDGTKELAKGIDYNVSYSNNINASEEAVVKIMGIGNYTGTKEVKFTINQRVATITAKNQTINYGNSIATGIDQVTTSNLVSGHSLSTITLTQSTTNVPGGKINLSGAKIVSGSNDVTANYSITYTSGNLTINKITPTLTLSPTSGEMGVTETISFSATANITGQFINTVDNSNVTISPATASGTTETVNVTGKNSGNSTVTVKFMPTDTTNYNEISKTYEATVTTVGYKIEYYQMNNDKVNYTLVKTATGKANVGSQVTGEVITYKNFKSPSPITITLDSDESKNVIKYLYERICFGSTCDYCGYGDPMGTCFYENRKELGLWESGLSSDVKQSNVRYTGTNSAPPNNNITFAGRKHRIIGVFGTTHKLRLVKNNGYSSIWASGPGNYYDSSNLRFEIESKASEVYDTELPNGTKYKKIIDKTCHDMWQTDGAIASLSSSERWAWANSAAEILKREAGCYEYGNLKYWPISLSDLMLATGDTSVNFVDNYGPITKSWLFASSSDFEEWTYHMWNSNHSYYIKKTGGLCANSCESEEGYTPFPNCDVCESRLSGWYNHEHEYRINFELLPSVLFCGGSGTEDDPYQIGSESC